jgi:uncharacterized protein
MYGLLLLVPLAVAAYPTPDPTRRVHDFAGIMTAEEVKAVEQLCQEVERNTTAQLAVVTVTSLEHETVEEYANGLFNAWGIGQRKTNNGVLFLIAPNDRRMRIEVGYGLEPLLTDSICGAIRDQHILPLFKQNRFGKGIIQGTSEIAGILQRNVTSAKGIEGSGPFILPTKEEEAHWAIVFATIAALVFIPIGWVMGDKGEYSTVVFVVGAIIVLLLALLALYLTIRMRPPEQSFGLLGGSAIASLSALLFNGLQYKRYGPRGCSKCGSWLELLSEQDDDPKLTSIQQLEEKIGSVNYDVWFCPACLNADTSRYINYFSPFFECPSCHARTFKEGPQQVMRAATLSSKGLAHVHGRCVSCNKKRIRKVILPRIVESSSTSSSSSGFSSSSSGSSGGGGSSFGGGSSGGGGASGSW